REHKKNGNRNKTTTTQQFTGGKSRLSASPQRQQMACEHVESRLQVAWWSMFNTELRLRNVPTKLFKDNAHDLKDIIRTKLSLTVFLLSSDRLHAGHDGAAVG
ncbi:unnamed protein product, partial [Ectocarpus sp. 12 AP-2014]